MSEWKKTTLREVIQINPATVDRDFKSEWIEYIDISSVGEGVITESPKVIKLKEAPSRAKRLVSKNDTVISTVRPNRRSMFFVREPKQNWVLSTGFAVLRPIPDKIEPRFLYAVVFNREFTEYLISREKGAAYPAVLPEDIYEAEILLPPLSEQKAIAHILGSLDDKIELNRRMNETLEASRECRLPCLPYGIGTLRFYCEAMKRRAFTSFVLSRRCSKAVISLSISERT
jgi:type I restriction enzyme S subunit